MRKAWSVHVNYVTSNATQFLFPLMGCNCTLDQSLTLPKTSLKQIIMSR